MTMHPKDMGLLLISAVRYALGRQTYIVGETCRLVREHLGSADVNSQLVIARDIAQELSRGQVGHACDDRAWRDLLQWLGADAPPKRSTPNG